MEYAGGSGSFRVSLSEDLTLGGRDGAQDVPDDEDYARRCMELETRNSQLSTALQHAQTRARVKARAAEQYQEQIQEGVASSLHRVNTSRLALRRAQKDLLDMGAVIPPTLPLVHAQSSGLFGSSNADQCDTLGSDQEVELRGRDALSLPAAGAESNQQNFVHNQDSSVDIDRPLQRYASLQLRAHIAELQFQAVAEFAAPLILLGTGPGSALQSPSGRSPNLHRSFSASSSRSGLGLGAGLGRSPAGGGMSAASPDMRAPTNSQQWRPLPQMPGHTRTRLSQSIYNLSQSTNMSASHMHSHESRSLPGTPHLGASAPPPRAPFGASSLLEVDVTASALAGTSFDQLPRQQQLLLSAYFDQLRGSMEIEAPPTPPPPLDLSANDSVQPGASAASSTASVSAPTATLSIGTLDADATADGGDWHRVLSYAQVLEGCILLESALTKAQSRIKSLEEEGARTTTELERLRVLADSEANAEAEVTRAKLRRALLRLRSLEEDRNNVLKRCQELEQLLAAAEIRAAKYKNMLVASDFRSFFSKENFIYLVHLLFGASLIFSSWWKRFLRWIFVKRTR